MAFEQAGEILKRVVEVFECDYCGGPAKWTLIGDEVYYHCQRKCEQYESACLGSAGKA